MLLLRYMAQAICWENRLRLCWTSWVRFWWLFGWILVRACTVYTLCVHTAHVVGSAETGTDLAWALDPDWPTFVSHSALISTPTRRLSAVFVEASRQCLFSSCLLLL